MAACTTNLDALPTECLAHVLSHLQLRDTAACVCASRLFLQAAALPVAWERRLARVFDLRLQVHSTGCGPLNWPALNRATTGRGPVDWPALYRAVEKESLLGALRFRAAFTDGGTDEGLMRYWADNMFAANHWESHCSARGANIHIVGLLLGGRMLTDEEEAAHRAYMVDRLRIPAQVVFDSGAGGLMPHGCTRLEAWSTSELEHFLQMLYQQLEMGMGLGRLLLSGVKAADVPAALAKLREVYDHAGNRHEERATGLATPPGQPDVMLDSSLLPLLQSPSPGAANHVASVDRIAVSRAGHFSCPLRTGLLLLGDWRSALGAGPDGSVRGDAQALLKRMQTIAADPVCRAFDGVTDRSVLATLEQAAAAGQLPRPVAWGTTPAGEWLEFDRNWRPPQGCIGRLRPAVWFRFFDTAESAAVVQRLAGRGNLIHASGKPLSYTDLPGPLASTPSDADMAEAVGSPAAGAAAAADVDVADAAQEAAPEQPAELMAANATAVDADAAATAMLLGFSEASGAAAGGGGTAAEEELPLGNEDHDGFHLEEFQDPELMPLDELDGSESEGDEDMFVGDAGPADGDQGGGPAAAAANGAAVAAIAATRAAARSTEGRNLLDIRLVRRHAGSLALVKLIDSENLMTAWHDEHEDPNIDVACVALRGRRICLPETVRFAG